MSTIQNLKNFIRHGKQAKPANNTHADPTTSVSPVHAQQQRYQPPIQKQHQQYGVSEPTVLEHNPIQQNVQLAQDYSAANIDHRNVAAQAGGVAAQRAADGQKINQGGSKERKKDFDPTELERIVAEEREAKGKFPKYPGLERFQLVEKMGDGAFSNVYRARDLTGEFTEVAIKVVRKYEMNSSQVSMQCRLRIGSFFRPKLTLSFEPMYCYYFSPCLTLWPICFCARAINTYIPISRSNPRLLRCASLPSNNSSNMCYFDKLQER